MACKQYALRGSLMSSMILTLFSRLYIPMLPVTRCGKGSGPCLLGAVSGCPSRYLAFEHDVVLDIIWATLVLLVTIIGYWIFRSAKGEDNGFRNGRNSKSVRGQSLSIFGLLALRCKSQTHMHEEGTKLLILGWCGRSRHPNYMSVITLH